MKLHVLTAVSRPENLAPIADSLALAAMNAPEVEVIWHWRFDLERQNVGGQAVKNALLDDVKDGWCWCLDDDTLAEESVFQVVYEATQENPKARAVIVSQRRTYGGVLLAASDRMCPGGVDIGQAFLRRALIGNHRIPIDYNGDGMFLQNVLAETSPVYLLDIVSLHNAISGVDVSA